MINKHIWPLSKRIAQYGRYCKVCYNCNDHEVEDNEAKTHTRIKCPECGHISPWHKTEWVEFTHEEKDGKIIETKTDQDGKVTVMEYPCAPQ